MNGKRKVIARNLCIIIRREPADVQSFSKTSSETVSQSCMALREKEAAEASPRLIREALHNAYLELKEKEAREKEAVEEYLFRLDKAMKYLENKAEQLQQEIKTQKGSKEFRVLPNRRGGRK